MRAHSRASRGAGWPQHRARTCQPEPGLGELGALLPSHRPEALSPVCCSKSVQTDLLEL